MYENNNYLNVFIDIFKTFKRFIKRIEHLTNKLT